MRETKYDEDELFPDHELVEVASGETTRVCPNCGATNLALFQTMSRKVCGECPTQIVWGLDKGQNPLVGNNRQKEDI